MPTWRRKAVPLVPLPPAIVRGELPADTPVYHLQATSEIFLDFESYSRRISFYLQKIFSCEATGRTNIDFYTALNSERRESENVHARFPEVLKGRILQSVQWQIMGRLDSLIDIVYERYKDRHFIDEVCLIDLGPEKYPCRVTRVFPPKTIRDMIAADPTFVAIPDADPDSLDYSAYGHSFACDLNNSFEDVMTYDPAAEYSYTVQLAGPDGQFDGTSMEARHRNLSRDRSAFSKSIMKRYLKECLYRDSLISSPWKIKARLARQYGLPLEEPEEVRQRNAQLRTGVLSKRKKVDDHELPGTRKKARVSYAGDGAQHSADDDAGYQDDADDYEATATAAQKPAKPKSLKYPIEDLALDPLSIYDGRTLSRVDKPALPPYPKLNREMPVSTDLMPDFLQVWNILNVFGWPLMLANFTLDQFYDALTHEAIAPRCALLAEMHGTMLAMLLIEGYRIPGTSSATATGMLPRFAAATPESVDATITDEERDRYVRIGLVYSRKWDRSKRLNAANARQGWERHLVGCLCQRGGIETLPQLPRILKHLFLHHKSRQEEPASALTALTTDSNEDELASNTEDQADLGDGELFEDGKGPPEQYLTLDLADKLTLLKFLGEMCMASRTIRRYIEDCDNALTNMRKTRIDINKTRKALLSEKAVFDGSGKAQPSIAAKPAGAVAPIEQVEPPSRADVASDYDELASGNDDEEDTFNPKKPNATSKRASLGGKKSNGKKSPSKKDVILDRQRVQDALTKCDQDDDLLDRDFRRHKEVMRIRPIGKDRFFNQYWFFDGIGTMELIEDGKVIYHTGRVFVQGPTKEDFEMAVDLNGIAAGPEGLIQRRQREEGGQDCLLQPDDWASLSTPDEFEALMTWLNSKGHRESSLKTVLNSLKPFILDGAARRAQDLTVAVQPEAVLTPDEPEDAASRRLSKGKSGSKAKVDPLAGFPEHSYMRYQNVFALK